MLRVRILTSLSIRLRTGYTSEKDIQGYSAERRARSRSWATKSEINCNTTGFSARMAYSVMLARNLGLPVLGLPCASSQAKRMNSLAIADHSGFWCLLMGQAGTTKP